ncbi:MAG: hypothetical protein JST28_09460 [Acidobacteria bacterium]|nr:hypothetical protein [Acidobacteriota bacterium]
MNRLNVAVLAMVAFAAFSNALAWTQSTAAPIAYVYVQTTSGVLLYDESADGRLTLDSASPFKTAGQLIGSTGSYVVTLGQTLVHLYPVTTKGRIGAQAAQVTMAKYTDGQCGSPRSGVLDHTGQYVEILFNPTYNATQPCTAYQTYKIGKSTGTLTFVGSAEADSNIGNVLGPVAQTSNNRFGYAIDVNLPEVRLAGFVRESAGALTNLDFSESDPEPPQPYDYYPLQVTEAPNNRLAMALGTVKFLGSPDVADGPVQLASYTVDSSGNISSTNTSDKMPTPDVGPTLLRISPGGGLLAVAGGACSWCMLLPATGVSGLQIFRFNGANPITHYTGVLTKDPIEQMEWDNYSHLFALSKETGKIRVYRVTTSSYSLIPGSPMTIKGANGTGPNGLVVVSLK